MTKFQKEILKSCISDLQQFCDHYTKDEKVSKEKLNEYMQIHLEELKTLFT